MIGHYMMSFDYHFSGNCLFYYITPVTVGRFLLILQAKEMVEI